MADTKEAPPATDPDEDLSDQLSDLLAGLPDGGTEVALWRRSGGHTGKMQFLSNLDPSEFSLAAVRDSFGGGEYLARPFMPGKGYGKGSATFSIAGEPRAVEGPRRDRDEDDAPAWARSLSERLDRMERGRDGGEASRSIETAVALATAMNQSMLAVLQPMLDRMTSQEGPDLENLLELVQTGLDIGRGIAPERSSGYDAVIERIGVPIADALTRASRAENGGARRLTNPAAADVEGATRAPAWVLMLRPHVPELVQLATLRGDVWHWSGRIVEGLDDAAFAFLADEIGREGFARDLYDHFPALAPHRPWCDEFISALRSRIEDALDDDPEDADPDD